MTEYKNLEQFLAAYEQKGDRWLPKKPVPSSTPKPKNKKKHVDYEQMLFDRIMLRNLPEPQRQYRFHPVRRWQLDFAWPDKKVACEVQGGIWMQTRTGRGKGHAHPKRVEEDCEKFCHLAMAGWLVLPVIPRWIRDWTAIEWLESVL